VKEVQIGPCRLINADCRDALACLDENSIDTIITDPPYGLSFMGKEWDHGIPGVQFWEAALRVAKPGAILMAFGGTRTFHRLACAIEDAGWELRDTIMWVYGTGFPKSLDISKAIDKAAGVKREDKFEGAFERRAGPTGNKRCDACGKWLVSGSPCQCPRPQDFPQTDAAKTWSGYGTALKPAWEPIIVAMKPLDGTFAENAIKHGVAGLNIDGGRIECGERQLTLSPPKNGEYPGEFRQGGIAGGTTTLGRFPANLIHDGSDDVMALFPSCGNSSGRTGVAVERNGEPSQDRRYTEKGGTNFAAKPGLRRLDDGSAARFFYCAKASSSERGDFNTHPTVKPLALMEYLCKLTKTPTGGTVLDMFMGSGSTGVACVNTGRSFIGIEREDSPEQPFFTITSQRIENAVNGPVVVQKKTDPVDARPRRLVTADLFGDDE